jgi:hypothetical protein
MDDWKPVAIGLFWFLAAGSAYWAVCRENGELRKLLREARRDADNARKAAQREADAQLREYRRRCKTEYIVRKLWKDRRKSQVLRAAAVRDVYAAEAALEATSGPIRRLMENGVADARSLAMCDELARYDIGGEAGV